MREFREFNYLLKSELEKKRKQINQIRDLPIPETVGDLIDLIDVITKLEDEMFELRRTLGENN